MFLNLMFITIVSESQDKQKQILCQIIFRARLTNIKDCCWNVLVGFFLLGHVWRDAGSDGHQCDGQDEA